MKVFPVFILICFSLATRSQNSTCSILVLEKIISYTTATSEIIIIDTLGNQQTLTNTDFFLQTAAHESNLNAQFNALSNLGYLICSTTIYSYGSINNTYYIWTRYILCKKATSSGVGNINHSQKKIILFPNPSSNELNVMLNNPSYLNLGFVILDAQGKIVLNGKLDSELMVISIDKLLSGNYLLKINGTDTEVYKFIKK